MKNIQGRDFNNLKERITVCLTVVYGVNDSMEKLL